MTESVDQGDLLWQVEQLREQNLKILGRWQEEKRRADEAARQLAVATRDAEMAKGNAENCYQRWYGAHERNLELERRLAEVRAGPQWQPIETAPKDRRPILLYCADRNRTEIGLWLNDKDGWAFRNLTSREMGWVFTHWLELPKPPKES